MVGFLSQHVLAQFDVGLPTAEHGDLYYVVPNIEAFATDHDLDPRQVRLWVALHEVTHQVQFARPWVRPHFRGLIEGYIASMEVDTSTFGDRMEAFNDPDRLQQMMQEGGGFPSLLSGPEHSDQLEAIQAFMAIVEGYGDYLTDRAAADLLPDLTAMRSAMRDRRQASSGEADILGRMLGAESKLAQYELGASFCSEVESRWGFDALARIWDGPQSLPTPVELGDTTGWAARVLLDDPFG